MTSRAIENAERLIDTRQQCNDMGKPFPCPYWLAIFNANYKLSDEEVAFIESYGFSLEYDESGFLARYNVRSTAPVS